jgi:hypothetical protein
LPLDLELEYLALEYVPAPGSILDGVHKLEAGSALVLDDLDRGGRLRTRRYFRLSVNGDASRIKTIEDGAQLVREHLVEATRKRLVADVPVGVFLSGGIDSSSVVAAAWTASSCSLPYRPFSGFLAFALEQANQRLGVPERVVNRMMIVLRSAETLPVLRLAKIAN